MSVLFIKVVFVSAEYSFLCQHNCFPNTTISVYGSPEGTNETFSFLVLQVLNIFFFMCERVKKNFFHTSRHIKKHFQNSENGALEKKTVSLVPSGLPYKCQCFPFCEFRFCLFIVTVLTPYPTRLSLNHNQLKASCRTFNQNYFQNKSQCEEGDVAAVC